MGRHPPVLPRHLALRTAGEPSRGGPARHRARPPRRPLPHDITDAEVTAWRTAADMTDADLVRLLAYGAITVVDRIDEAVTGRTPARSR